MTGSKCATETKCAETQRRKDWEGGVQPQPTELRLKQDLRACGMFRFGFVLLLTALPLLGMEAMSTRRETTKQVFDSAAEALDACQRWRHREGQFSALIPAAAPVSTQARPVQTDIRSCEADLDHALVLGRRYSVVTGVHYNKMLRSLHRPIHRTFPYLPPGGKTDD